MRCQWQGAGSSVVTRQQTCVLCLPSAYWNWNVGSSFRLSQISSVHLCRSVVIETDHKPLQATGTKPLSQVPLWLQKMILDVRGYNVEIRYTPGSKQVLEDMLSRASVHNDDSGADEEFKAINLALSVSEEYYEEFQKETKIDPELQAVLAMVKNRWADKSTSCYRGKTVLDISRWSCHSGRAPFQRNTLNCPKSLKPEMLHQIHKSHLGIVKCRQRTREVLFWPGMSVEIEQMVTNCSVCADYAKKKPSEPLKPSVPPSLPLKKIGTDLFEFCGEH